MSPGRFIPSSAASRFASLSVLLADRRPITTACRVEKLVLLFTSLFPVALARQRSFHTLFLTGLQVKRMPLYFLYDVLSLDFSLEAAKGVLQRFALLNFYFCQRKNTPLTALIGPVKFCSLC